MSTTTLTKTVRTLIAAGTTCEVGTPQRASVDLRTAQGGLLTMKITNGATGPTAQCVCNVLAAHSSSGTTPTLASAGGDWKTLWSFGGGTTNSAVTEQSMLIDAGIMWLEVEFKDNTAQNVTVEAYLSEITSVSTT